MIEYQFKCIPIPLCTQILNTIRREKVEEDYVAELVKFYNEGNFSTEGEVNFNELKRSIEQEIELLPKKMREVFELSRNQNLSHAEIATQLDISDQTVKKANQQGHPYFTLQIEFTSYNYISVPE